MASAIVVRLFLACYYFHVPILNELSGISGTTSSCDRLGRGCPNRGPQNCRLPPAITCGYYIYIYIYIYVCVCVCVHHSTKMFCDYRPSEACFPIDGLLNYKENGVHVDLQCRMLHVLTLVA
jgi:hypothetical protein